MDLSYNGIYLLDNIVKLYKKPYESKLYEGNFCVWQDVYDGWTFEDSNLKNAVHKLDELLEKIAIYIVLVFMEDIFPENHVCLNN